VGLIEWERASLGGELPSKPCQIGEVGSILAHFSIVGFLD